MPTRREQDAQRHLDQALAAAGADFTATCERRFDGYAVTFRTTSRQIFRSGTDEAVLEDDASARLERLIQEVRQQMDEGPRASMKDRQR